jgi:hypothetical protein
VEGDPRQTRGCGQAIKSLPDGVWVRWAAVFERQYVVAAVIVDTEELSLAGLPRPPSAQCRERDPIDRYRFVGVVGFAARFVSRTSTDDHPVVVDRDFTGVEIDGRPLEPADLTTSDPSGQFEQEECSEAVLLHRFEESLDVVWVPHRSPLPGSFGRFDVACRVVADVFPRDRINEGPVEHCVDISYCFRRETKGQLLGNDAQFVPANRCSGRMDRRAASFGDLARSWVVAVRHAS